jgi:uncharacterized protein YqiB (DUF1249 family)
MPLLRRAAKTRYAVDLEDLHSLCEANYARLLKVFPDYEQSNQRRLLLGVSQVVFDVTERSRYTTTLRLSHLSAIALPGATLRLDLRLYHDAMMAEVVGAPAYRRMEGRYSYPNAKMYQRDEKHQQNRYVAELLAFCLAEGREPDTGPLLEQR